MQRSLPRPAVVDIDALLKRASFGDDEVGKTIAKEAALLMANDALQYPLPGAKVHGTSKPLEKFDDEILNEASLEILRELPLEDAEKRREEFEQAWEDVHNQSKLPGLVGYEDDVNEHEIMLKSFDTILSSLTTSATRGNALEKRLALHFTGYQTRAKVLRQKITEAAEALTQAKTSLDMARTAQVNEDAAIGRRLESLRAEVQLVGRREREAQENWKAAKEELDALA
jgi:pre-mRNA-splicing factor CDC5/CEF1